MVVTLIYYPSLWDSHTPLTHQLFLSYDKIIYSLKEQPNLQFRIKETDKILVVNIGVVKFHYLFNWWKNTQQIKFFTIYFLSSFYWLLIHQIQKMFFMKIFQMQLSKKNTSQLDQKYDSKVYSTRVTWTFLGWSTNWCFLITLIFYLSARKIFGLLVVICYGTGK